MMPRVGGTGGAPSGNAGGVLDGTYPNPSFADDMATQAELDAKRLDQIAAPTADVSLNDQQLIGLPTPSGPTAAANKAYVDAIASGFDVKLSVRAATTANITLSGAQTIDGVSVVATNRVLVKNQTDATENGIYVAAAGAWSRSTDADTDAEVTAGLFTFVEEGGTYADQGWALATNNPITLGSTELSFTQVSGVGGSPTGTAGGVLAGTYPNPSFAADMATQAELDAHLSDGADAHDASAISLLDAANDFAATDVEGALAELQTADEADEAALAAHIGDASAAHSATAIGFTPDGTIAALTVQAAIVEVRDEAAAAEAVDDATIATTDITTNNATTTKHGWLRKLDNNRSHYIGGKGEWNALHPVKEWFVDTGAVSGGDGHSPAGSFTTFAAAMAAVQPRDIVYVLSDLSEDMTVAQQELAVIGVGGRRLVHGTGTTIASRTLNLTGGYCRVENFHLLGHATFKGIHFICNRAVQPSVKNIWIDGTNGAANPTFYPTSSAAGTGNGGIGVCVHGADVGYFEQLYIVNTSIAVGLGTWSTRYTFNWVRGSQNCQELVIGLATGPNASPAQATAFGYGNSTTGVDNECGSCVFMNWTMTTPISTSGYTTPPTIHLIGDGTSNYSGANGGHNYFHRIDAAEGGFQPILKIDTAGNVFDNCTIASGTRLTIGGQHNTFNTFRNQGNVVFTGDYTTFNDPITIPTLPGWINGSGSYVTFRNATLVSQTEVPLALTGSLGTFVNCKAHTLSGTVPTRASFGTAATFEVSTGFFKPTYGTSVEINARAGEHLFVDATNTVAFTLANPIDTSNIHDSSRILCTQPLTIEVRNNSGGATHGAVSVGNKYALIGGGTTLWAANTIGAGKSRLITIRYNHLTDKWLELSRSSGDV